MTRKKPLAGIYQLTTFLALVLLLLILFISAAYFFMIPAPEKTPGHEGLLADGLVVLVHVLSTGQHAVLHRHRVQLARADSDEGVARNRSVVLDDLQRAGFAIATGAPQRQPRREQEALPRVRPDHEAEAGVVVAPFQPVHAGLLVVGPAHWEVVRRAQLVVDDGPVTQRGSQRDVSTPAQNVEQGVKHEPETGHDAL